MVTFLSHSEPERQSIEWIARRLKQRHGLDTWYAPRDCVFGQPWVDSIVKGLARIHR